MACSSSRRIGIAHRARATPPRPSRPRGATIPPVTRYGPFLETVIDIVRCGSRCSMPPTAWLGAPEGHSLTFAIVAAVGAPFGSTGEINLYRGRVTHRSPCDRSHAPKAFLASDPGSGFVFARSECVIRRLREGSHSSARANRRAKAGPVPSRIPPSGRRRGRRRRARTDECVASRRPGENRWRDGASERVYGDLLELSDGGDKGGGTSDPSAYAVRQTHERHGSRRRKRFDAPRGSLAGCHPDRLFRRSERPLE